jgi:hypothetical protein
MSAKSSSLSGGNSVAVSNVVSMGQEDDEQDDDDGHRRPHRQLQQIQNQRLSLLDALAASPLTGNSMAQISANAVGRNTKKSPEELKKAIVAIIDQALCITVASHNGQRGGGR